MKANGGNPEARVDVKYKGSSLHSAMMIPVTFFNPDLRKRLVKLVGIILFLFLGLNQCELRIITKTRLWIYVKCYFLAGQTESEDSMPGVWI